MYHFPTTFMEKLDFYLTTAALLLFFAVGTLGNSFFVYFHLNKRRHFRLRNRTVVRFKNKVNNDAVFASCIANLVLCSVFIPYTLVIRINNYVVLPELPCKIFEHIKDSLLYLNLFLITIIAFERYVAICQSSYYSKLEKEINSIIWMLYSIALLFAASNYFVTLKCYDLEHADWHEFLTVMVPKTNATLLSTRELIRNNATLTEKFYIQIRNKSSVINLWISVILFSSSAIATSFFYVRIAIYQSLSGKNRVLKPLAKSKNRRDNSSKSNPSSLEGQPFKSKGKMQTTNKNGSLLYDSLPPTPTTPTVIVLNSNSNDACVQTELKTFNSNVGNCKFSHKLSTLRYSAKGTITKMSIMVN
jgi:hypothetical protein